MAEAHWVNLQQRHVRLIKKLFTERYTLEEIHLLFLKMIPYDQLRHITKDIKRQERI
jgi:hypothetical protein